MLEKLKNVYKVQLAMLCALTGLFFIGDLNYKNLIAIITFGVILIMSLSFFDNKKDNNYFRWSATKIVISVLICVYVVVLICGIYLGFSKTFFSLNIDNIFVGILPTFIITLMMEYLRFIIIKNNFTNKKAICITAVLMMTFNIVMEYDVQSITQIDKIFIYISTIILPMIAREILATYIVLNFGYLPTVVYKVIMNIYVYIIPMTTKLGDYLYSVVHLLIPFVIYYVLKRTLKVEERTKKERRKVESVTLRFVTIPTTILLIMLVILVSGITKYHLVAIASGSMYPSYQRGDAVIYEKIDSSLVRVGDILVFESGGSIVTHRVVKIREESNKLYFYTKGDANDTNDSKPVKQEEVRGVVRNVVKYIGYPTVMFSDLMK